MKVKARTFYKGEMYYTHHKGYPGHLDLSNGDWEIEVIYENGDHGGLMPVKEVELFTGIYDQNGKEIFEGDLLQMQYGLAIVYFKNGCFKIEFDTDSDLLWLYCRKNDDTKVVGNIHENPELLK
jgi:hypothetical protein